MTGLIKSWEAMLASTVGEFLAGSVFVRRGSQEFQKTYEWGKAAIHLTFIEHADDFDVTADVAIRFNALEELVQKSNKFLTEKEKKNTFSMRAELGNLVDGEPLRWTIANERAVSEVAKQIYEQIVGVAFPYIERHGNLRQALQVFASDEKNAWIHSPIHGERAKRAVGLAWLLEDRPMVVRLVELNSNFLRGRKDFGLADFELFAKSLT